MLRPSAELEAFELRYARQHLGSLTYHDALALFTALWCEARELNPAFPGEWREDIAPDLAIARAVNGLPAAS
jgi:hypothetical protein